MLKKFLVVLIVSVLALLPVDSQEKKEVEAKVKLTEKEVKAIDWLASIQDKSGGWGSHFSRVGGGPGQETIDIATTCIVTLSLLYSGSTPTEGKYKDNILNAVNFVLTEIERFADDGTPFVTDKRNTQPQIKVGQLVDTYNSSILLSRVEGKMPDEKSNKRVKECLEIVVAKIKIAQEKKDSNRSWAGGLGDALAIKGLIEIKANQSGEISEKSQKIVDEIIAKNEKEADKDIADLKDGRKLNTDETAGVELYKAAEVINKTQNDKERQKEVVASLEKKLQSDEFRKGYGTMGGEEFVSYMLISQSLCKNQSDENWTKWNSQIKETLYKIQNPDGTWAGQHCITSKTYCTAAALITLLTDQNDVNVASK